jgi:hypothetical protein
VLPNTGGASAPVSLPITRNASMIAYFAPWIGSPCRSFAPRPGTRSPSPARRPPRAPWRPAWSASVQTFHRSPVPLLLHTTASPRARQPAHAFPTLAHERASMRRDNRPRIYFSLLALCYLEVRAHRAELMHNNAMHLGRQRSRALHAADVRHAVLFHPQIVLWTACLLFTAQGSALPAEAAAGHTYLRRETVRSMRANPVPGALNARVAVSRTPTSSAPCLCFAGQPQGLCRWPPTAARGTRI